MTVFSIAILWSVGINSGSMINGIIRPLWMENQTVTSPRSRRERRRRIITEHSFMIWMGGAGATLSLVIADADVSARSKETCAEVARLLRRARRCLTPTNRSCLACR